MSMLNSGNVIGHYGGPVWTPYAQAIASHYSHIIPWFDTVPTNLSGVVRERQIVIHDGYEHDLLLFGAHINIGTDANGDNGQQVFLQVNDLETGITWTAPSPLDCSPATAYGGSRRQTMPILKLPEAFFLPANVQLRHEWRSLGAIATGGTLTWVGVQLINPKAGKRPKFVTMPDGKSIPVGSRLPWFSTTGLGDEIIILGSPFYVLGADSQSFREYYPPNDCDVEIHDIHANWFTQAGVDQDPKDVLFSLTDTGDRRMWSADKSPAPSVMGDVAKAYPALPLTKPYMLKQNRQLQLIVQNKNAAAINNAFVTIRGVRLCNF